MADSDACYQLTTNISRTLCLEYVQKAFTPMMNSNNMGLMAERKPSIVMDRPRGDAAEAT